MKGYKRYLGYLVMALLILPAIVATLLASARASWLDFAFSRFSQGRVALAETQGTLWQGSGRLVLVDVAAQRDAQSQGTAARFSLNGVAIPGRVSWNVNPWALLRAKLDLRLKVEGMAQEVKVLASQADTQISAGALSLPAVDLSRLGSPWSTLKPSGALALRWDAITVRPNGFDGKAQIELREASSALSPVNPVGSYRVDLSGKGNETGVLLSTLQGPLQLTGQGQFNARTGLKLTAEAKADEKESLRLQSLLGLIGRREGDKTIIRVGA